MASPPHRAAISGPAPASPESRAEREAAATRRLEAALTALATRDRTRFDPAIRGRRRR